MVTTATIGPDIVVAGAARCGTSSLASQLGTHPQIDPGQVKEPNYFSRQLDRGADWYDGLYRPRGEGLLRLDASVSYTTPLFPDALARLAEASPDAYVVYMVREPTARTVSHYLFRSRYFRADTAPTLGASLRESSFYHDVSDYSHWLPLLQETFPRVLVVPFEVVKASSRDVAAVICAELGLAPPGEPDAVVAEQRNNVVELKSELLRKPARMIRQSRLYPKLRGMLGASRTRRVRSLVTREASLPSVEEVLASCDEAQLEDLRDVRKRAAAAVDDFLDEQDRRLGLSWRQYSFADKDR